MIKLGLIGYPLKHTLSPVMHNAALAELDIKGVYLPFELEKNQFAVGVNGLKALGFSGYNVTIPYKVDIIPFLDEITDSAKAIGAVNTVIFNKNGTTTGDNTDLHGFVNSIIDSDKKYLAGKKATIIGAGGASRAVGAGLLKIGLAQIDLYDLNINAAEETAELLKNINQSVSITPKLLKDLSITGTSILINASPVGMMSSNNDSPVDIEMLTNLDPNAVVYDLVYRPVETYFIREAKKLGFSTYNGAEMLVLQGALSLQKWLNKDIPVSVMRNAMLDVLNNESC